MKVFVDTNIFIDILLRREPFVKEAIQIYKLCENGLLDAYIAPITINNIYYICRKSTNIKLVKEFLGDISHHFIIADMNEETVKKAVRINLKDFEDALQYTMAIQNGCEYIVTRNTKDFKKITNIEVVEPEIFLERYKGR